MKSKEEKIITFLTKSFAREIIISVIHAELFIETNQLILIVHTIRYPITYLIPFTRINIINDIATIYFIHPISRRSMYIDLDIFDTNLSMSHIFNFNLPSI